MEQLESLYAVLADEVRVCGALAAVLHFLKAELQTRNCTVAGANPSEIETFHTNMRRAR